MERMAREISAQDPIKEGEPTKINLDRIIPSYIQGKGASTFNLDSMNHKTNKSNAALKHDAAKPAIALAGHSGARIVVVPADEVRRERERAAQPEVRRPRVPASGLTGRLAFEALFK